MKAEGEKATFVLGVDVLIVQREEARCVDPSGVRSERGMVVVHSIVMGQGKE